MSNIVFGEIDWNDGDVKNPQAAKTEYMRLTQGANKIRVMGNPVQFYVHWVQTQDGSKRKIVSPISSPDLVRRLEDSGFKRQAKWLIKVLDRSDDGFKLLEVGSQIYNGIRNLYNDSSWGKVTTYDITINRGPKGAQPLYGVTPNPKTKIPSELKDRFAEFNKNVDVERAIKPTDPEVVCELMGWNVSQYVNPTVADNTTDDDDDYDFDFE